MNTDKTTQTASVSQKYTLEDVGCYVDGAWGIYVPERVIKFAVAHGADITCTLADVEFINEREDDADAFMNARHSVDGAYWGRNDQGDWGLWEVDDYAQHEVN